MSLRHPIYQITADDQPLNATIERRIISLTVTDNRSDEADQLDITLDDSDGQLKLPKRGVTLNIKIGFSETTLCDKGDFIVDETEWSGTPDTIKIKASSANFKSTAKTAKSQSFHGKKLGEIASKIAKDNDLEANISPEFAQLEIGHIDQTEESDLNFLKRLAKANSAEMAVKKDRVLIFKAGSNQTASGQPLPQISISRSDGDQFRYNEQDRDGDHTGVSASYTDQGKKTKQSAQAGQPHISNSGDSTTKTKHIKGTFASQAEAERAAQAEMARINQKKATFNITLAYAIPDICSESPVTLHGFKSEVDSKNWTVAKATHSFSTSGLTTQLELEANI